ncbi:DUF4870 domain-containing protein [Candidatus Dojkabacteria bacterium]|nr:DUF4870 domain-containing protein [Candidatus Dojkabacteria bacterium]
MAETTAAPAAKTADGQVKTNAMLAWLFAPITSFIWMNDANEFLQYHAKQSLSWSLVSIVGHIIFSISMAFFIGLCLWPAWALLDIGIRVYGLMKANNGEKWEVPVVGGLIK